MKRFLAQEIIDSRGKRHRLSLLTISDNGDINIEPFDRETAGTVFVDGTLTIGPKPEPDCTKTLLLCKNPQIWLSKKRVTDDKNQG